MIKYIGSKRLLINDLVSVVNNYPQFSSILDLFSGTARCGHAFKRAGLQVVSNDHNKYAHTLASCYVEANREDIAGDAEKIILELNSLSGKPGWFTDTYCIKSRFFQPKNGEKIDAIREKIEELSVDGILKSVLLTSLMEAADRVDSTCGIQMAYVKKWATRSYKDLFLKLPEVLPSVAKPCKAVCMDASNAIEIKTDIVYLDPPYNQHSYLSNYHIWESLLNWDKPEVYGIACKRIDCRTKKSAFNSKKEHKDAFANLIKKTVAKLIIVSFNDEGYQTKEEMKKLLSTRGKVKLITKDYKRYVGAQIGIYNLKGNKVGKISHLRNKEYIYVVEVN